MPATLDPDALLAQRFQNDRPGLSLIAVVDGAVPVVALNADTLAQESKAVPLLDEFVLRFVSAGIATDRELAAILGLDADLIIDALADQFKADNLRYAHEPGGKRLVLTQRGARTATELASIHPVRKDLRLVFDRLTWKLQPYEERALITRSSAEESGHIVVPAAHNKAVTLDDVLPSAVNEMLRDLGRDTIEVLTIRKVKLGPPRRYLPVKLLVFADGDYSEVQVAVAIDGELSAAHELALARLGGAEQLGIRVDAPEHRPELASELEQVRVSVEEVSDLRTLVSAPRTFGAAVKTGPAAVESADRAADTLERIGVRAVSVFEHPELLADALTTATRRILIISPWVKNAVVNADFTGKLESRLRKGVKVHIGYGIGEDDSGSDQQALDRIRDLQRRHSERLRFARLPNTHAKILIFDGLIVTTSFNWLSFRGDPSRTYRMEEGTLVRVPEHTDERYEHFRSLIEQSQNHLAAGLDQ